MSDGFSIFSAVFEQNGYSFTPQFGEHHPKLKYDVLARSESLLISLLCQIALIVGRSQDYGVLRF